MTLIPALMAILGERAWEIPRWLERLLPHVDIEGEAVERERHLAAWPGDGSVVAADDLRATSGSSAVSFRVAPGSAIVAIDDDRSELRALALAVSGRLPADDGRLRVAGHLLPGRAAWVRAHVGCVLVDETDAALDDLAEALRGRSELVVIDGLDRFDGSRRDQATAMLRDASARRTLAVFATASDPSVARAVLAEAGWPDAALIDIRARHRASDATEVTA